MIKVKPLTKKQRAPLERFLGCEIRETVTAGVTENPKRNGKSNAERQRLFRLRKRMRGLTDEQFLAETVNADG